MSENGGALTVYQRMNDPLEAVKTLGTAIAKSGMFGCGSIEQGQVFALECLARGMPPLTLAERYHVVQGKLMMKYDAMLAEFHNLGGKHKIVSRTEERAEIELSIDGETHVESCTWEQAKGEKWPFKSDGKTVKDNWATPKARRQMLWARVVSEGVRALRPGVNNGRYVAEEIDDDSLHAGNGQSATVVSSAKPEPTKQAAAVDVPFEVKVDPAKTGAATTADKFDTDPTTAAEPLYSTAEQRAEIESLFDACYGQGTAERVEKFNAAIAKRKAGSLRGVTAAECDKMIGVLRGNVAKIKAAANAVLPKVEPPATAATTTPTEPAACGPCTAEQNERIGAAIKEWMQVDPANAKPALGELKKKLADSGRKGILDLSANDAAKLFAAIQSRVLAGFISRSLEVWKPLAGAETKSATAA